ncbi:MAG: putative Ig domain-containing protein, partial [Synergistaceae bacterium]|nr:putative Ig domain-containing protein [Synergistaceae bacterium]
MATRRLFLMALVVMTIMALAAPARAATYGGGSGTQTDPFLISTKEHLEALREAVNAGTKYQSQFFKMTRDIDLGGELWTLPIGKDDTAPFSGTFDGDGHAIAGLNVNMNVTGFSDVYAGLFGYVVGGTISRLSVSGDVAASSTNDVDAGGIAGGLDGGTIEACSFTGTVKAEVASLPLNPRNAHAGGIAGATASESTVTGCTVYGASITASVDTSDPNSYAAAGGIVGRLRSVAFALAEKITDCVAEATVRATHTREPSHAYVGGTLGWSEGLSNVLLSDNIYHGNAANGIGRDRKSGNKPSNDGAAKATGPSIVTVALPGGTAGTWWRRDLIAAPSGSTFTWRARGLPKGLELDKKTGVLKGIPEKKGAYEIAVTVESGDQSAAQSYQIVIAPKAGRFDIEEELPEVFVGQAYSHALSTTGGKAASWKIEDGELPKGMKFNEARGRISGTPRRAGDHAFVVTAEKSD